MLITREELEKKISIFNTPDFIFDPLEHKYTYKGEVLPSVTGVLKEFSPPFDEDYWLERKAKERDVDVDVIRAEWDFKRDYACDLGTEVHEWIEDYYNQKWRKIPVEEDRANRIKKFVDIYVKRLHILIPLVQELRMWSIRWKLAGTLDALFIRQDIKNNKTYLLVGDWKTNKEFTHDDMEEGCRSKLLEPFSHLYDNKLNNYSIQISIYRLMLEEHGIETDGGFLVHLGPDDQEPKVYKAKDLRAEIKKYLDENYGK